MRLLTGAVLVLGVGLSGCDSGQVIIHGFVISALQAAGTPSTPCKKLGSTATLARRLVSGVSLTFTDQDGTVVGTAVTRPGRAVTLGGGCEVQASYSTQVPKKSAYSVRFDYGGVPQSFGPITEDQLESTGYRLNLRMHP
jgi:hypothetical protein